MAGATIVFVDSWMAGEREPLFVENANHKHALVGAIDPTSSMHWSAQSMKVGNLTCSTLTRVMWKGCQN